VVRPGVDPPGADGALATAVEAAHRTGPRPAAAAGVEHVGVARVDGDRPALVAAGDVDRVGAAGAGHTGGAAVLLLAADQVRVVVGGDHAVDLAGRVVLRGPRRAAVGGHGGATVVGLDHPLVVLRVDPQGVVVAVRQAR